MAFEPTAFEPTAFEMGGDVVLQPAGVNPQGIATPRGALGLLDAFIDPVTLDYVDTDDGEWYETADSRTIVLCQLEIRLDEDFYTPEDGTRIKAALENDAGLGITEDLAVTETLRALSLLVRDGTIENVTARATRDESGRLVVLTSWRDRATGTLVDNVKFSVQGAG